jgi:hypothetical protein
VCAGLASGAQPIGAGTHFSRTECGGVPCCSHDCHFLRYCTGVHTCLILLSALLCLPLWSV